MKNKIIKSVKFYLFLIVFLLVLFAIAHLNWPQSKNAGILLDNYITFWILGLTGVAIIIYTFETKLLRETEQQNLKFQKAPFIIVHFEKPNCFILKNVGKGVARNITWKIVDTDPSIKFPPHTVISPNSNSTKIRDSDYEKYGPAHGKKYEINVDYEDCDGLKYYTKLKSGKSEDDYVVLEYCEKN